MSATVHHCWPLFKALATLLDEQIAALKAVQNLIGVEAGSAPAPEVN